MNEPNFSINGINKSLLYSRDKINIKRGELVQSILSISKSITILQNYDHTIQSNSPIKSNKKKRKKEGLRSKGNEIRNILWPLKLLYMYLIVTSTRVKSAIFLASSLTCGKSNGHHYFNT